MYFIYTAAFLMGIFIGTILFMILDNGGYT